MAARADEHGGLLRPGYGESLASQALTGVPLLLFTAVWGYVSLAADPIEWVFVASFAVLAVFAVRAAIGIVLALVDRPAVERDGRVATIRSHAEDAYRVVVAHDDGIATEYTTGFVPPELAEGARVRVRTTPRLRRLLDWWLLDDSGAVVPTTREPAVGLFTSQPAPTAGEARPGPVGALASFVSGIAGQGIDPVLEAAAARAGLREMARGGGEVQSWTFTDGTGRVVHAWFRPAADQPDPATAMGVWGVPEITAPATWETARGLLRASFGGWHLDVDASGVAPDDATRYATALSFAVPVETVLQRSR